MAGQVIQMDYEAIEKVAKTYDNTAKTLTAIGKALKIAIEILRATAFLSAGTALALANYLENILKKVNKLIKLCNEFAGDLRRAVQDHKNGDSKGKSYFGEGVRG